MTVLTNLLGLNINCSNKGITTTLCEFAESVLETGISVIFVSENHDIITSQNNDSVFTRKTSPSVYLTLSSELPPIYSPRVINSLCHVNRG